MDPKKQNHLMKLFIPKTKQYPMKKSEINITENLLFVMHYDSMFAASYYSTVKLFPVEQNSSVEIPVVDKQSVDKAVVVLVLFQMQLGHYLNVVD
jgi:hypothetical protein